MIAKETPNQIIERELSRLEARVDELAAVCHRLRADNRSLLERLDSLAAERALLLQKNEQVRGRVEAMVSRLRTLEEKV